MKKDYILIIAGIIPLLFSVFVMNFFLKDDRSEMFESAKLLEEKNISQIAEGELVKFSGFISTNNPKIKDYYVIAVREKFVKGQNGKRSEWVKSEFYLQPIQVKLGEMVEVETIVANDYLPCGDGVKISDLTPKQSRLLGILSNTSISAVGRVINLNPMKIQTGHTLCTGTIEDYKAYLNKKLLGYLFILLCISVPSLGLIYLGLFKGSKERKS